MFSLAIFKAPAECSSCVLSMPGSRIHSTSRYRIPPQFPSTHLHLVRGWKGPCYNISWSLDRSKCWAGVGSSSLWDAQPSSSFLHEESAPGPDNLYQVEHSKHLSSQVPAAWTPVQKHSCQKCTCFSSSPPVNISRDSVAPGQALIQQQPAAREVCTSIAFSALPWWIGTQKSPQHMDWMDNSKCWGT